MKRRAFIQSSTLTIGGLTFAPSFMASPNISRNNNFEKITILHTNDTHSNVEPFSVNHSKYPNRGGVARRFELIQSVRNSENNVLLLDAGDFFQGTPYFNKFGGTLELKLMSQLGYDAATLGNHDFDAGLDGFYKASKFANFDFLCANYDFSDTILHNLTSSYKIFEKGSLKIGVFGIGIQLEGLVAKAFYGETKFLDPIEQANLYANRLRNDEKCDLVICLSHLGHFQKQFKMSDPILASQTENIDIIIGGHTHTFLSEPELHLNKKGEHVVINQVGYAGLVLGRIDVFFENNKRSHRHKLIKV